MLHTSLVLVVAQSNISTPHTPKVLECFFILERELLRLPVNDIVVVTQTIFVLFARLNAHGEIVPLVADPLTHCSVILSS